MSLGRALPAPARGAPPSTARLGKYEILRRLAVGGMAEIFLARVRGIEGFSRLVVLKRILPAIARDRAYVRMFIEEARLAATLQHCNIAQVYDIDRVGDAYFFAMEYVHGVDLRQITRAERPRGGVPLEHAITIIAATAAGLHYAHEKTDLQGQPLGLVHRDVSPPNVLIGYDGGVKLVDFGIAKANRGHEATQPGLIRGKLAYLSPEQCMEQPLDRRSDIFALGILLYELTTGTLLFEGLGEAEVFERILGGQIPVPSSRRPGYPPELEAIVRKATQREPADRYPTARELERDLQNFARERKMLLSSTSLSEYMEVLFGADLERWRRAQESGISLVEFVSAQTPDEREDEGRDKSGVVPAGVHDGTSWTLAQQTRVRAMPFGHRRLRWGIATGALILGLAFLAWRIAARPPRTPAPHVTATEIPAAPPLTAPRPRTERARPEAVPAEPPAAEPVPAEPVPAEPSAAAAVAAPARPEVFALPEPATPPVAKPPTRPKAVHRAPKKKWDVNALDPP